MEHSELKFSGINRKVSDYSNAGACEELINLRPLETGLEVVKKKGTLVSAGNFTNLFVHHTSFGDKYIAEERTQSNTAYYCLGDSFAIQSLLASFSESAAIAFLGDLLIFSDKGNSLTAIYRWNENSSTYIQMESNIPDLTIQVSYGDYDNSLSGIGDLISRSVDVTDFFGTDEESASSDTEQQDSRVNAMLEFMRNKNKNRCYGMCILAFNLTLTSGEEFWTFKYVPVDPYMDLVDNYRYSSSEWDMGTIPLTYSAYKELGHNTSQRRYYMFMPSAEISLNITRSGTYTPDKSLFRALNVYSTIPFAPFALEPSTLEIQPAVSGTHSYVTLLATPDPSQYTEHVANAMFYKQFSIDLAEMGSTTTRKLEFGTTASQSARTVMKVDAGAMQRFGEMFSYNNRLHYYDSIAHTIAYPAEFNPDPNYTTSQLQMNMSYKTSTGSSWVTVNGYSPSSYANKHLVCCPDSRIDKLKVGNNAYPMSPSNKYNFSFCVTRDMRSSSASVPIPTYGYFDYPEDRVINVTGQMSPLEFPVENSYGISGKVRLLAINNDNLTESQTGQWPVYVYTDRGVFAMEQGNGEVLYSKITPVSMLVAESNVAATPYGQFFISGGHLYNLKGKYVVIVSDALESEPNKELRETDSYQEMFNGDLYGIIGLESSVDFRTFCKNATVTFDPFADEIIVSNLSQTGGGYDYPYSYVLDLRRRQWHKIDTNSFPAGNTTTIAKMFTTASLGARAVGRIQVKVSDLYAHPIYSEADYTMFTSDEVTYGVTSFPAGTTLTVRRVDNQYIGSTYVTTENTPAKIALAKLFPMSLVDDSAPVYDIEYLSNGKYRLLVHYGNPTVVGSPAWGIYRGEEENPIMTFTFSDTPITARFQKKSTGVYCRVSLGAQYVSFIVGNAAASTIGSSEALLAQEIADTINSAPGMPATASRNGSTVTLVAKEAGPAYNLNVAVSPVYSSNKDAFYNVAVTNMTGGSAGGQNDYFCNLAAEEEDPIRLVHLESRPVSFGYALSHILRTVLLVKARLQALSGVVAISVFGSDDLFSWKCISTGQKKAAEAQLTINRIRNNRASHSWRYYKVCIGGYVPTEADIAQVIVDWYAINRRIG